MSSNSQPSEVEDSHHYTSSVNGIRMHYRRTGGGPELVVCLHGFPQNGRSWEKVAARLAAKFTVISPDLRGAGESQTTSAGFEKKTMAADVHALVVSLGFDRIHLVGHDIGGMVAYAYAAQWPSEVASLTMIEMLLPGFGIEALYAIRRPGDFAHIPFFMAYDLPEWLVAGRESAFLDWFIRRNVSDQSAFAPEDIERYAHVLERPGALRAVFEGFRAFWQDATDNKQFSQTKLTMPVLAIGAASNVGSFLENSLQPLAENVRGIVFENCGHFIPDEQPEKLADTLEVFFGERE